MSRVTEKPKLMEHPLEQSQVWWGIAVALPVAIAAGFLATAKVEQLKKLTNSVAIAPTTDRITALGHLEPRGDVIKLAGAAPGSRVREVLVKEGEWVRKNQVIAILDGQDSQLATVEEAKAKLLESRANLAQIRAGSIRDIQAQKAVVDRLEAQLGGEQAGQQATIARVAAELSGEKIAQQATVNRLEDELRGQKDSLRAMVARTKAEHHNAQVDANRYDFLYREGAISQQERDRRRLSAVTSDDQVIESQANLKQTLATLRQQIGEARAEQVKTIATLEQQLIEAKVNRDKTIVTLRKQIDEENAKLKRLLDVNPTNVQVAQAQVTDAIASLQKANAELQLSYIKAPITGEILKIHTRSGEAMSSDGIAEIGQTNHMFVITEVPEDSIGKVRVGQTATITSDNGAFSGELKGIVTEIGRQVGKKDVLNTDPAADVDSRVVEVKVALLPEYSKQVSGLTYAKVVVQINN